MNENELAQVKKFLNDEAMSGTIYQILLDTFLKPRGDKDIHTLAAQRIAIDLLHEAFKELDKLKKVEKKEPRELKQIGL